MPSFDYPGKLYCRECEKRFVHDTDENLYVEWDPEQLEEKAECKCLGLISEEGAVHTEARCEQPQQKLKCERCKYGCTFTGTGGDNARCHCSCHGDKAEAPGIYCQNYGGYLYNPCSCCHPADTSPQRQEERSFYGRGDSEIKKDLDSIYVGMLFAEQKKAERDWRAAILDYLENKEPRFVGEGPGYSRALMSIASLRRKFL